MQAGRSIAQFISKTASARSISYVASFGAARPEFLKLPTLSGARNGLDRVGLTASALRSSPKDFQQALTRINRQLAPHAGGSANPLMTREEALGLAHLLLKTAHALEEDLDGRPLLSAIWHLLSPLKPGAQALGGFQRYATALADELPKLKLLQGPQNWWECDAQARKDMVREVFLCAREHAVSSQLLPGRTAENVQLIFEGAEPCGAMFYLDPSSRSDPDPLNRLGRLVLSEQLLGPRPSRHAEVAFALMPVLIAHELRHAGQHGSTAHAKALLEPMETLLSMGLESSVQTVALPSHAADGTGLLHELPHEKDAWSLAFLLARALVQHPKVPSSMQQALRDWVGNEFDHLRPLLGLGSGLRVLASSGELWDESGERLELARDKAPEADRRLEAFLAEKPS